MTRLIHWPIDRLKPKGGPSGYLFNLEQGLEENGTVGYEFLPEAGHSVERSGVLQRIVPKRIKDLRRLRNLEMLPRLSKQPSVHYEDYSSIHFHSTEDLYVHRKALEQYTGTVILTSHSPCVYHQELIARLNPKDAQRATDKLKALDIIDEYSFKRADYIIFPCTEAEEPLFHTWERYEEIRDPSKIRYCLTGTRGCRAAVSREETRRRFGIPQSAFVITYVGRHNKIKGYADLLEVAPFLLKNENVWFLNAGKEGPLYGLNHPRWIEAGWTDDPHSIIAAADVFVLPNKETYFDLVLLEVLSLGQLIVASNTGGNRLFERLGTDGIRLYDEPKGLVRQLDTIMKEDAWVLQNRREENKALFESSFTCQAFARRYAQTMDEIEQSGRC